MILHEDILNNKSPGNGKIISTFKKLPDRIKSIHGDKRIREVARKAGLKYKIHYMIKTKNAMGIEKKLLTFGKPVDAGNIDGKTEFREIDDKLFGSFSWVLKEHFNTTIDKD